MLLMNLFTEEYCEPLYLPYEKDDVNEVSANSSLTYLNCKSFKRLLNSLEQSKEVILTDFSLPCKA